MSHSASTSPVTRVFDAIEVLRRKLAQSRPSNEAAVSSGCVLPLLRALDWNPDDYDRVVPEYSDGLQGSRVDFALLYRGHAEVFIEVKQQGRLDAAAERQLFGYALRNRVPILVLTDGDLWAVYCPLVPGRDFADCEVARVRVNADPPEETARVLVRYLRRDRVENSAAWRAAQEDFDRLRREREIQQNLERVWREVIRRRDPRIEAGVRQVIQEVLDVQISADAVWRTLAGLRPHRTLGCDDVGLRHSEGEARPTTSPPSPVVASTAGRAPQQSPVRPMPSSLPASSRATQRDDGGSARTPSQTPRRGLRWRVEVRVGETRQTFLSAADGYVHLVTMLLEHCPDLPRRFHSRDGRPRLVRSRDQLAARNQVALRRARQVPGGWWLDVNYGREALERLMKEAVAAAGLSFGPRGEVEVRFFRD